MFTPHKFSVAIALMLGLAGAMASDLAIACPLSAQTQREAALEATSSIAPARESSVESAKSGSCGPRIYPDCPAFDSF